MTLFRVVAGDNTGKVYPISAERLTIGRESDEIPVLDQGVSRLHAEIFKIGEMFFIRDLESRNGTFVNSKRVDDQEILRTGDRVHIGNTELVFEDRFSKSADSQVLRFGDSIDNPDSTISFRLDKNPSPTVPEDDVTQSEQLQVLYNVSRHLGVGHDLEHSLRAIAKELADALNADHVYLFAFDNIDDSPVPADPADTSGFRTVAAYDRHPVDELAVSRSILRRVMTEMRPILSSDATLDDRFTTSESIVLKKIKSLLCVPLLVMGKPIGAFYATNSKLSEAFSPEDLTLATTVGMMVGNAVEIHDLIVKQGNLYRDTLKTLANAIALRTPEHRGRSERIATHAAAIARGLGLPTTKARQLWIAGLLSDIGLLGLSEDELKNAVNLEQRKAKLSGELLAGIPELESVVPAVRHHTERYDGTGFPDGLKGNDIPLEAEIVGLACEFEALMSEAEQDLEPAVKTALMTLRDQAGKKYSTKAVNGLLIAYRRNLLFQEDRNLFAMSL